jgi:GNAT superfamily N-acetyltransferase
MAGSEAGEPGAAATRSWLIERLQPADAEDLCPLSKEAGWNQVAADWHLMLTQGRGYGVRSADRRWIASALVLPLGPSVSWLSMVLVTQPMRGQGLGTLLLRRLIADVETSGAAAGLDATELGRPIYVPLGFRDVYSLSRWYAPPAARQPLAPPAGIVIGPATADDVERMCLLDASFTGLARAPVLSPLFARAQGLARIARREDGAIAGFCLARDGRGATQVGPIIAEDEAIGLALLSHALAATGEPVIADIPDRHADLRRWLAEHGAFAPRSFVRMLRGDARLDDGAHTFALAGPELA